ncbi:glycosyltransferase [Mucilaginibacter xinganensis]|uniref:Glycosyltransferase 2-like domain-containing protein n=1 Tax=Mucilaginibacter xinganensis TaxID=1234841 RepID=A0A223P3X5_9SPHI|nr:glycosyltransferase [Mucilaginibacter xinganensis]ASU36792.1 hypothetical protein MuYL_4909 [Mucilaginibacter xinganensis]
MSAYQLSFIIATRNRLPFLKITLEKLMCALQPDEEIVVVDGDSTDGAKEYLQQLFGEGKIHQFVSEPDHNQAHGWNKALLLARGTIIKKVIDDDVYSFTAISKCKQFMLANPLVDICISNGLTADLLAPEEIATTGRLKYFKEWKSGNANCFTFSDVYMLIRKSALSYLGLFDTQFTMLDWEYSLRCSYLKANIVYYTGYNALSVNTPGNVTSSAGAETLKREGIIGKEKYGYKGDRSDISLFSEMKIAIGKAINYKAGTRNTQAAAAQPSAVAEMEEVYNRLYDAIEAYNLGTEAAFIS